MVKDGKALSGERRIDKVDVQYEKNKTNHFEKRFTLSRSPLKFTKLSGFERNPSNFR